jgi:hypothetical protein
MSADRGKALDLKYQPRQVFGDSGARHNDNEETIIGTQLRLGMGRLQDAWAGAVRRTLIGSYRFGSSDIKIIPAMTRRHNR